MADIIHLLPDTVANQIAAGEVIQRPSSVIKELMENAVDAGATSIDVWVTDAGKTCIQVMDNGKGMSETDARLSFERHATSKITKAADLFDLHTMGFRGEALPSIAAVSQVDLKTKTKEEELGTWLSLNGSKIIEQKPVVCQTGATFTISNLFYNVPARRRFLRSNQTELSNIMTEFERVVLVHPNISFTFHRDNVLILDLRLSSFRKRITSLFGTNLDKQLLPVHARNADSHRAGPRRHACRPPCGLRQHEAGRRNGHRGFVEPSGSRLPGRYGRNTPCGRHPRRRRQHRCRLGNER